MKKRLDKNQLIVTLLAVGLILPWLGLTLFYTKGEPREAVVALSILQSGEWILPVNFGGDIPYKPPFMAWCIAILAKVFNGGIVNEYIARMPSALAAIALAICTFRWASRARNARIGLYTAIIFITSFEIFRAASNCRLDMLLTVCMVVPVYIMQRITDKPKNTAPQWAAVIILLSCAALTKGPIGSLLPCMIIGIYRLKRHKNFFATLFLMLIVAAVALIPYALWTWEAYTIGGQKFLDLMLEENIGRLTGNMSYESHVEPFYYNFITIIAGLLPWTILAIAALFCTGHRSFRLKNADILALVAAISVIAFYTIPESKRSVYLLPAYPFLAYGLAIIATAKRYEAAQRFFAWFMAPLAILAPIALPFLHHFMPAAPIPYWAYVLLIPAPAAAIAWMCTRRKPTRLAAIMVAAVWLAYAAVGMPTVLNPKSDAPYAQRLNALPPQTDILLLETQPGIHLYNLNYYTADRLRPVATIEQAASYPAGTVMIMATNAADSALTTSSPVLKKHFEVENFMPRSCEYRAPFVIAIKK